MLKETKPHSRTAAGTSYFIHQSLSPLNTIKQCFATLQEDHYIPSFPNLAVVDHGHECGSTI